MWHGRGADFCCSPRDLPIPLLSRPAPCAFLREQRANPQFRAITKSSSSPSIAVPVLGVTKVRRARPRNENRKAISMMHPNAPSCWHLAVAERTRIRLDQRCRRWRCCWRRRRCGPEGVPSQAAAAQSDGPDTAPSGSIGIGIGGSAVCVAACIQEARLKQSRAGHAGLPRPRAAARHRSRFVC